MGQGRGFRDHLRRQDHCSQMILHIIYLMCQIHSWINGHHSYKLKPTMGICGYFNWWDYGFIGCLFILTSNQFKICTQYQGQVGVSLHRQVYRIWLLKDWHLFNVFLKCAREETHTGFPSLRDIKCFQMMKKLTDGIKRKRKDLTRLHKLVENITHEF